MQGEGEKATEGKEMEKTQTDWLYKEWLAKLKGAVSLRSRQRRWLNMTKGT